jgi:methylmalonyl-CoA mutase
MEDALFKDIFPPVSKKEWLEKINKDLRGKSYESLVWEASPGIEIDPLYTIEDFDKNKQVQQKTVEGNRFRNDWLIRQTLTNPNRKEIKLALESGVDSIVVDATSVNKKSFNDHFIVKCYSSEEINRLRSFNPYFKITIDPIGAWIIGKTEDPRLELIKDKPQVLRVSGNVQHEAGATAEQELSGILAWLNEYLHYAKENNLGKDFAGEIEIQIAVGIDFFTEIAKLRAVRLTVSRLLEVYEIDLPLIITGKTSQYRLGHKDQYTNLLRNTTMALSAVIAGVDVLEVRPHTLHPDSFSLRLARNIQHLLKEEAFMDKVADMSGGSYLVEELTEKLATRAWEHFQLIEQKGGWINQVNEEKIKTVLVDTHQKRVKNAIDTKKVLVGINQFKNPKEDNSKQRRHKPLSKQPHVLIQQQISFDIEA